MFGGSLVLSAAYWLQQRSIEAQPETAKPSWNKVKYIRYFGYSRTVAIHMKNIKYLLNTFIFGNKLRIQVGL